MPGTTYTREGPTRDAAGRLADFARFAVAEIDDALLAALTNMHELGTVERRAAYHAQEARGQLDKITQLLNGYTTADD